MVYFGNVIFKERKMDEGGWKLLGHERTTVIYMI